MGYLGNAPADQAIQIGSDTILSSHIDDGVIVNADINASAAIAMSKTQLTAGTGITLSTNTLNVDAAQTQITSVGTIATGVWNGTKVASAYLDDDTAHLSTNQTFSGIKTFGADYTSFNGTGYIRGDNANKLTLQMGSSGFELKNNAYNATRLSVTDAGNATFAGTIASGAASSVGIGTAQADANSTEVGPGYINLARDDTADAKQIQFTKNGSIHSSIETTNGYFKFYHGTSERLWISNATDNWGLNFTGNSPYGMQITTTSDGSSSHDAFVIKRDGNNKVFEIFNNGALTTYGGGTATFAGALQSGAGAVGATNAANWQSVVKSTTGGTIASGGGMGYFALGDNYTTNDAILMVRNDGNRGSKGHASGSSLFKASFNDATAFEIKKSGQVQVPGEYELIETIRLSDNTSDFIRSVDCFTNDYTMFKIVIGWIGVETSGADLWIRYLLDGDGSQGSSSEYYGNNIIVTSDSTTITNEAEAATDKFVIFHNVNNHIGTGIHGELKIFNVTTPTIGGSNTDRGDDYRPYGMGNLIGHNTVLSYTRQDSHFRYNVNLNPDRYTGFRINASTGNLSENSYVQILGRRQS